MKDKSIYLSSRRDKEIYRCTTDEMIERLEILKELTSHLDSNDAYSKMAPTVLSKFISYDDFRRKYSLFIKYREYDPRLEKYSKELDSFKQIKEILKDLNKIEFKTISRIGSIEDEYNYNLDRNNYMYAEYIINAYIDYKYSYLTYEFYKRMNIDRDIFNYCIKIVKMLDPTLYKKYLSKVKENNYARAMANANVLKDLAHGIETGYLEDGTEFNLLVFYKKVPFKDKDFMTTLRKFMSTYKQCEPYEATIFNYIYKNNARTINYINREMMKQGTTIIKGTEITDEMVDFVFDYIELYHYPKIKAVYRIIINKYLDDELSMDDLNPKPIYESKNIDFEYKNPYTLIRKNKEK